MIAIADSGSTKTDWLFISKSQNEYRYTTPGINPIIQTDKEIQNVLNALSKQLPFSATEVKKMFFYGAGCSSKKFIEKVKNALHTTFSKAEMQIEHDLTGAAKALYKNQPIIACILGTGSNSCYFDGTTLQEKVPALGYILGDEGSGADIGKRLLKAHFYQQMDEVLTEDFSKYLSLNKEEIFTRIYYAANPNRFLASLCKFAGNHKQHPVVKEIVKNAFDDFIHYHVLCYENAHDVPVSFVGSVAFYFQDILSDVLKQHRLQQGIIIKQPVEGLKQYHLSR